MDGVCAGDLVLVLQIDIILLVFGTPIEKIAKSESNLHDIMFKLSATFKVSTSEKTEVVLQQRRETQLCGL